MVRFHLGYAAAAVGYMTGIGLLTSAPAAAWTGGGGLSLFWNILHVPLYAGLALCLLLAVTGGEWSSRVPWRLYAGIAFIAGASGAFDEWHQAFVPGRYASVSDFLLNCVGIAGLVLVHRLAAPESGIVGATVRMPDGDGAGHAGKLATAVGLHWIRPDRKESA